MVNTIYLFIFVEINLRGVSTKINKYNVNLFAACFNTFTITRALFKVRDCCECFVYKYTHELMYNERQILYTARGRRGRVQYSWFAISRSGCGRQVSHPHRLDPTMELITYSFVLYLQHGCHDVKCKTSIENFEFIVHSASACICKQNTNLTVSNTFNI